METVQTRVLDKADFNIVHEAVTKANKKAAKLGQPGFVLTSAPAEPREVKVPDPFHQGSWKIVGYVEQVEAIVTGTAPRIAGWTFVATLEWDTVSKQAVIRKIDGLDVDLSTARPQAEWCDHCNTARTRSNTYLLRHDDGSFKQVGSTCLREFLGVEVNLQLLGFNPYEGCDTQGIRRPERLSLISTFEDVIAITRAFGWVSAGAAYNDSSKLSTKERFGAFHWDHSTKGLGAETRQGAADKYREDDKDLAATILTWVRTVVDNSEYIENLKAACAADDDTFNVHNLGLVVSAPFAYQRYIERQEAKAAEAKGNVNSVYQGTVGERLRGLKLTVKSVRYIDGAYGLTTLYVFTDEAGNSFKWFCSASASDFEVGQVVVLDGTVKKHEEFNGLKSTVLTRCKVTEVVAA
jgi:hypothetical protein